MTTVTCPHCSQAFEIAEDAATKSVRCRHCDQEFAPGNSALASGAPPVRPGHAETAVTDKAPAAASTRDADDRMPAERRDIAKKSSSAAGPILIIGAVIAVGLCVCVAPALLFLGGFSFFAVQHDVRQERAAVAQAAEDKAIIEVGRAPVPLKGVAKGRADAADAIAKEKLLWKEYPPLPGPAWHGEYIKLLKERCKCDYQVIQGPLAKDQEDEIKGWNEAINAELIRRHGPNILGDLQAEAEKNWRAGIGAKEKK
jgi:hypothetical protein